MGLYVSSAAAVSPAEGLPSGYDTRQRRALSRWAQDELTAAIRTLHATSDGVYRNPKIWQVYRQQGDRCRKHRIAQLILKEGLCGIPALTHWKRRRAGERPAGITNELVRDFSASRLNAKLWRRVLLDYSNGSACISGST